MHRQFRKLTKTKGAFPNENSLLKLLYMGIQNASKKWTMPLQNWNLTLSQIYFEGRLDDVLHLANPVTRNSDRRKPFACRAHVTTQLVAHALAALFSQMSIEIIKAGKLRLGHHEVAPGVSHHPLDFAFVIPLAGTAKSILKQIMRTSSENTSRVRLRVPSPRMRATAIRVLS